MTGRPGIPAGADAVTAEWMGRALAVDGGKRLPTLRDIEVEDIGAGLGLTGRVLRCRLAWRDGGAPGPGTVVVKLPSEDPATLRMSRRHELYRREYDYYRRLGETSPMRSPALLYGDFEARTHRFVLVLEDLRGMESADQIAGADAAQAMCAVRAAAQLHAHYWHRTNGAALSGIHDTFGRTRHALLQVVYMASLGRALERFGGMLSNEMRALAQAYGPLVAEHLRRFAGGARTFIHGDYRLDNLFFGARGECAAVDWQVSGIGCSLFDVASFLGSSVSTEVRRAVEREALREYHAILVRRGVAGFDFHACWQLYRHCMLFRLAILVIVCGGLDLDDVRQRRLVESGLQRTLDAIAELDAGECVPARPRLFGLAGALSAVSKGIGMYGTTRAGGRRRPRS